MLWWFGGGREQLLLSLQPPFQVIGIDRNANTMTLHRMNQTYVVDCAGNCDSFVVGQTYRMLDRGGILEFRLHGQQIRLRVTQVHVDFDTVPGGHG
jgi:hypothetical protein